MQSMMVPEITLRSGRRMPVIGMGTGTYPPSPPKVVEGAVIEAIRHGYRHIDTAGLYGTEHPIGCVVAAAVQQGLISSRSDLFITSKLWCTDMHPDRVLPALTQTLEDLGTQYVDLYLIHFPVRLRGSKISFDIRYDDIMPVDMVGVWAAMEMCCERGLTRSIGVSNFTCKKLSELLLHARILPEVNQVELHPLFQQKKLREFCDANGIHVSAYSPLGAKGLYYGTDAVLGDEEINAIARLKGKTPAQVCLRWGYEQGVSILPKSFNKERLKENLEIFDWELDEEDMQKLSELPQKRLYNADQFVSPLGIYKTHSEFWDSEM